MELAPLAAWLCVSCFGAPAAAARAGDAQQPPERALVDGVAATVGGEVVLSSEVERLVAEARERYGEASPYDRDHVLALVVQQRLLEQEAREAGVAVDDERLAAVLAARVAAAGGDDAYRAELLRRGSSPEVDREQVRRALAAERFVDECLGLVPGSPRLRPHLARGLAPTPADVRAFFREHRDALRTDGAVVIGLAFVPKGAAGARGRADAIAGEAADAGALVAAAGAHGATYREVPLRGGATPGLRDDVESFLATAPAGVVSPVFETATGFLVVAKRAENAARPLTFAEVQPRIAAHLVRTRRAAAEQRLVAELLATADVWPDSLRNRFAAEPPPTAPAAPREAGE